MSRQQPLVTIITATWQARNLLPITSASIRAQTMPVQWIVADGGSTDGTVEWLQDNHDIVDYWFSEPDSGIYDAWNKSLQHIRGDWVLFLGAGDRLAAVDVIESIASELHDAHPVCDLVYGKMRYIDESGSFLMECGEPWHSMEKKWEIMRPKLPKHPEVFHHRSVFDNGNKFDTRFRIASDSHFLLRQIMLKPPVFVPVVVTEMLTGGMSASYKNSSKVLQEIRLINQDLSINPPAGVVAAAYTASLLKSAISILLPSVLSETFSAMKLRNVFKKVAKHRLGLVK